MTTYDAIVFDGGGRNKDGSLTTLSLQRLNKVVELYKSGLAKKIISSGGLWGSYGPTTFRNKDTGAIFRKKWFMDQGVKASDIIPCPEGGDTVCGAIANYKVAYKHHFSKIILVTSDIHMPRCLWIFKKVFGKNFTILPAPAPCGDLLIENEEKEYFKVIKKFFPSLKTDFLKANLNTWHDTHKDYFSAIRKIHDKYHPPGHESQAYIGTT